MTKPETLNEKSFREALEHFVRVNPKADMIGEMREKNRKAPRSDSMQQAIRTTIHKVHTYQQKTGEIK